MDAFSSFVYLNWEERYVALSIEEYVGFLGLVMFSKE